MDNITKSIFAKRGFAEVKIINEWPQIVGTDLAKYSSPVKISFRSNERVNGILSIEVYDSAMSLKLSFMQDLIIEKIACYFNYKAVSKIKIIQKPGLFEVEDEAPEFKKINLSDMQKEQLQNLIKDVEDEDLRERLLALGSGILQK